MAANLSEQFRQIAGDVLIHQLSGDLGETAQSTSVAVATIASALSGAFGAFGKNDASTKNLLDYLESNNINESILPDLSALLDSGPEAESIKAMGADVLKFLLGDRVSPLIDLVSGESGLKTSSASTLLKVSATIMAALLIKNGKDHSLNVSGTRQFLSTEASGFTSTTTPALQAIVSDTSSPVGNATHGRLEGDFTPDDPTNQTTFSKLLPWIVLLIAAVGLFYFLDRGSKPLPADTEMEAKDTSEVIQDPLQTINPDDTVRQFIPDTLQD